MSKDGFALLSFFLKKTEYIPSIRLRRNIHYLIFDIYPPLEDSLFQSLFFDQTGRFVASGWAETLYETSSELRRVGHRADHIPAGTVARPTLPKFIFRLDRPFFGRRLG
jgi:hypothetical protein